MKILVDYREKHLVGLIDEVFEDITLTQLPVGDYLIISGSDAVLVERKTVTDFWSSIRSNRLWDQLLRMMKKEQILGYHVKRRILLIHGNFEDYFEPFFYESKGDLLLHWSQLMGAYQEIIYVYNTPIIHAGSDVAFKAFMRILARREASGKNDKLPEARWYRKPARADLPVRDRKKYILSSLPYIGDILAENLLMQFATISDIACASIEDLKKVPKIGAKKAELIYRLFHS